MSELESPVEQIRSTIEWSDLEENEEFNTAFETLREQLEESENPEVRQEALREFKEEIENIDNDRINEVVDTIEEINSELDELAGEVQWGSEWEQVDEEFQRNWRFESNESDDPSFLEDPGGFIKDQLTDLKHQVLSTVDSLSSTEFMWQSFELLENNVESEKVANFFERIDFIREDENETMQTIISELRGRQFFWDDGLANRLTESTTVSDLGLENVESNDDNNETLQKLVDFIIENNEFIAGQFSEDEQEDKTFSDVLEALFDNPASNRMREYATPSEWVRVPNSREDERTA